MLSNSVNMFHNYINLFFKWNPSIKLLNNCALKFVYRSINTIRQWYGDKVGDTNIKITQPTFRNLDISLLYLYK